MQIILILIVFPPQPSLEEEPLYTCQFTPQNLVFLDPPTITPVMSHDSPLTLLVDTNILLLKLTFPLTLMTLY